MKTTELIQMLKTQDLTETEAYNLIVNDLFEAVPESEVALPASQLLVRYFLYKIQSVCFAVITELRKEAATK